MSVQEEKADALDPEYWINLGGIAQQGSQLLLSYGAETDPAGIDNSPGYEDMRQRTGGEHGNPFSFLEKEFQRRTEPELLGYLDRHNQGYEPPMTVSDALIALSELGDPTENEVGMNGGRISPEDIEKKAQSLSKFVEYTLGDTVEEGVDMSSGETNEIDKMAHEADCLENSLYSVPKNI